MAHIKHRDPSPRPLVIPKMSKVAFEDKKSVVHEGILIRMFTPAPNAGKHYEIRVAGGYNAVILAQGPVGRTVTRQQ